MRGRGGKRQFGEKKFGGKKFGDKKFGGKKKFFPKGRAGQEQKWYKKKAKSHR